MIKINWAKFADEHWFTQNIYKFLRDRMWYGWWWASFCSVHMEYNKHCRLCRSGDWSRVDPEKQAELLKNIKFLRLRMNLIFYLKKIIKLITNKE